MPIAVLVRSLLVLLSVPAVCFTAFILINSKLLGVLCRRDYFLDDTRNKRILKR